MYIVYIILAFIIGYMTSKHDIPKATLIYLCIAKHIIETLINKLKVHVKRITTQNTFTCEDEIGCLNIMLQDGNMYNIPIKGFKCDKKVKIGYICNNDEDNEIKVLKYKNVYFGLNIRPIDVYKGDDSIQPYVTITCEKQGTNTIYIYLTDSYLDILKEFLDKPEEEKPLLEAFD